MAVLPVQLSRVSNLLRNSTANQSIVRTQQSLLEVQNQLSTGKSINNPSDDPGTAAIIMQLKKVMGQRDAYSTNLNQANSHLGEVDSTLGDMTDLMQQAQQIASANVGSVVSADQRASAAAVVKSIYGQMLTLGNKEFEGVYLFGGDGATSPPFVEEGGGVKFTGTGRVLENAFDENTQFSFMVSGEKVFGATSTRVQGTVDLAPRLDLNTRLSDLRGAIDFGVRKGTIRITSSTGSSLVDLSGVDSVGDCVNKINAAGIGVVASVSDDGMGLKLTGTNVTVEDLGGGTTAVDLGIKTSSPTNTIGGASLKAKVTDVTPLTHLKGGAGIDLASGLKITNGLLSATVRFTTPPLPLNATMQDMINAINNAGVNVKAEINAAGTGINILNPTQGSQMTIAENGGSTAADLGIRSFSTATELSELNLGRGVGAATGADFRIIPADGFGFDVDLGSSRAVQDVLDAINAASGGKVTASFATTGNGVTLRDNTSGPHTLAVQALNFSTAAADLDLTNPSSGGIIHGGDVNPVKPDGIYSHLIQLRNALESNDQTAITQASEGLQADYDRIVQIRGTSGARIQEITARQNRLEDENLATKGLLSQLEDVDFTEAISRFQMLQTALQANLQTTAKISNLSLLDFLG